MGRIAGGRRTAYPGVLRLEPGRYRIRAEWTCLRTGKRREVDRVVEAATPIEASKKRDELRASLAAERRERPRTTLRDFAVSWLQGRLPALKASTASLYATALGTHIVPALGDLYLDAITREDVIAWRDAQRGEPSSINGRLRVLRTLLRDAAADFSLPDPTSRVAAIRDVRGEDDHKVLEAGELRALLESMRVVVPRWYPLALTLATTGMRWGEASALKWSDIDEDRGVIVVRRAHWHGIVDTTKTDAVRTVPLSAELAEVLREHRRALVREQHAALGDGWAFPARLRAGDEVREDRAPLSQPSAIRGPLSRAAKAAGIAPRPSSHWFRHTLSDLLRRTSTGLVQRSITGHVTEAMGEHYAHVTVEERRGALTSALRLVRDAKAPTKSGDQSGDQGIEKKKAR